MEPPGRLEEQAAVRRHRRRRPRGRGRARSARRRAGGDPGAAGRAAAGRRAARCCRPRRAIATTLASDIWPGLVDEQHVDRRSAIFGDAQSHDVPAATLARPSSSGVADVAGVLAAGRRARSSRTWSASPRWTGPDVDRRPRRPRTRPSSRLPMTLWLVAVMPTRLPGRSRAHDHPRPGVGLARARRSLDRRASSRSSASASRRAACEVGLVRRGGAAASGAWPARGGGRSSRSRAARCGPSAVDPVLGDPLAELEQRRLVIRRSGSTSSGTTALRVRHRSDGRARMSTVSAAGSMATQLADRPVERLSSGRPAPWRGS